MTDLKLTAAQKQQGQLKMRSVFSDIGSKFATNMFADTWKKLEIDGIPGADKDRIEPAVAELGKGLGLLACAVDFADFQKCGQQVLEAAPLLTAGEWVPVAGVGGAIEMLGHVGQNIFNFSVKCAPAAEALIATVHQDTLQAGLAAVTKGGGELFNYTSDAQKHLVADNAKK